MLCDLFNPLVASSMKLSQECEMGNWINFLNASRLTFIHYICVLSLHLVHTNVKLRWIKACEFDHGVMSVMAITLSSLLATGSYSVMPAHCLSSLCGLITLTKVSVAFTDRWPTVKIRPISCL